MLRNGAIDSKFSLTFCYKKTVGSSVPDKGNFAPVKRWLVAAAASSPIARENSLKRAQNMAKKKCSSGARIFEIVLEITK